MAKKGIILGAGITGLVAGMKSALPVYEAEGYPGGICASYCMSPGETDPSISEAEDEMCYKFSIGGGHWIFGADVGVERLIKRYSPIRTIVRKSCVWFPDKRTYVAYPIQNNIKYLGEKTAQKVLSEISNGSAGSRAVRTMKEWLRVKFGPTLFRLFFGPFHKLYTAGLYETIAPQDLYKSPSNTINMKRVGYNASFIYPRNGLEALVYGLAKSCQIHFKKRASRIDVKERMVTFEDGSAAEYDYLVSTVPLNRIMGMTGLAKRAGLSDPHTSVLVLNIGAIRGERCPDIHWLYVPCSKSGFFRIGFYSNVDASFLPEDSRKGTSRVSIYVERAYKGGRKPTDRDVRVYSDSVIRELEDWKFIKHAEVIHPTWIDVAYTWSWPGSAWRDKAIKVLSKNAIYQVGRYGLWRFQGIAESIRQGLAVSSRVQT